MASLLGKKTGYFKENAEISKNSACGEYRVDWTWEDDYFAHSHPNNDVTVFCFYPSSLYPGPVSSVEI